MREPFKEASPAAVDVMPSCWVLVKGFSLSYHFKETFVFTIDPYYGI